MFGTPEPPKNKVLAEANRLPLGTPHAVIAPPPPPPAPKFSGPALTVCVALHASQHIREVAADAFSMPFSLPSSVLLSTFSLVPSQANTDELITNRISKTIPQS